MKLSKLLSTCILAIGLSLPLAACDDGDDGDTTDTNADADAGDTADETTGEANDIDCSTFCTSYVDMCIQTLKSEEFETNDQCLEACAAWDQAGINCRNGQIVADACDQAGDMGSAC